MTILLLSIALYALHRLGPISVEVMQRHVENAAIASFRATLVPAVEAFEAAYVRVSTQKARLGPLLQASVEATAALNRATSAWLGPVGRDLPDFDARAFGVNREVDQDALSEARRLIDVVQTHGEALPYAGTLVAEITSHIEAAEQANAAAQEARVVLQGLQGQTRELGASLQRELVALRRTLRAELGVHHLDYQRLRAPRPPRSVEELVEEPATPESADAAAPELTSPETNGRSV
jgi:hypothetical protein